MGPIRGRGRASGKASSCVPQVNSKADNSRKVGHGDDDDGGGDDDDGVEERRFVPRRMPNQNLAHRLIAREMFGTQARSCNSGRYEVNTGRGFYLNVFPNYTVSKADKPPCYLRKFSPDGRYFIAFSACQAFLEIYSYNGPQAAASLIHECTCGKSSFWDHLGNDDSKDKAKLRTDIFARFFTQVASVGLCNNHHHSGMDARMGGGQAPQQPPLMQQLNRECSLFTECSRYVVVGSACFLPDDPHPLMHETYRNNESVTPNPRNPLENITLFCVELESGVLTDTLEFRVDKIILSHNQGVSLFRDRLAILSVQHQTIHLYRLENGRFVEIVRVGRTVHDNDDYLLARTGMSKGQQVTSLPQNQSPGSSRPPSYRPYQNFRERVINQMKHKILVFLYRRAAAISEAGAVREGPYELRRFYQYFDQIRALRMWKMQLLDKDHLLIKYASEEVVTLRSNEPNSQFSLFVVYNFQTKRVLAVYENTSEDLVALFEKFADHFRNTNSHHQDDFGNVYDDDLAVQHQFTPSPSNNIYANHSHQKFKQTVCGAKNGGLTESRRRVLAQLPISSQSYTPSPYLDPDLFSYDEKWISVMERPKGCNDQANLFYGRESGLVKFRLFVGMQGRQYPPNSRRLSAFMFHPYDPFAISVQRTNLDYVVNFHVRRSPFCDCDTEAKK